MNAGRGQDTGAPALSLATIDSIGWGLFFIWIGVALFADVGWGVTLLGVGIIVLYGQAARVWMGQPMDWWGAAVGTCLVVAGLTLWLDLPLGQVPIRAWFFPLLFLGLGVAILASAWRRKQNR